MKKFLPIIGLYLGTFVALNVGMYFLLMFMQPNLTEQTDEMSADSTAALLADSSLILEDIEFDHAPDEADSSGIQVEGDLTGSTPQAPDTALSSDPQRGHDADTTGSTSLAVDLAAQDTLYGEPAIETEAVLNTAPTSSAEISKLAKVLEGMKPSEAAVIAERLPTETIVELVMRMKSRNGAKMMASLPVPVAASVAIRMAELSGVRKPS